MLKFIGSSLLVLAFSFNLIHAQKSIRELPKNLNHPSVNLYAPFVSGDGQSMIYLSDYADDGHHVMYFAKRKGVATWDDGAEITKVINRPTHNFRGGYSLSFDGSTLFYTSRKSGLGGYEIWYSEKRGDEWGAPKNMGGPVNSADNEGSPMISPDGQYLYFMRCESMSEYKGAKGCKLMVAKRKGTKWDTPQELPANINTGNSQTPRILADGETLFFASDQMNGKGGLDIYMTRKLETGWTDPKPLDFINDQWNNCFVSVPAKGRYMFADIKGARSRNLAQVLIPEEFKPKAVMRIQGKVTNTAGEPVNANLRVFNIDTRKRLWNDKVGTKGEFTIVLNEGASYDLSITDGAENMYYAKVYELDSIGPRDKERLRVTVEPIQMSKAYPSPVNFEAYSDKLSDNSTFELRRIADLMRKNATMKIEVGVHLHQYLEDSIQSNADLTEVIVDSVYIEREAPIEIDTTDSLLSTALSDSVATDSLSLDTLNVQEIDTIEKVMIKELQLNYTYHNDRTEQQAESIKAYLVGRGIAAERIALVNRKDEPIENPVEGDETITQPEVSITIVEL